MNKDRIPFSDSAREQLRREIKRTRLSPEQVAELVERKTEAFISPELIRALVSGTSKTIQASQRDVLSSVLASVPDAPKSTRGLTNYNTSEEGYLEITESMAYLLRAEIERTGANITLIVARKPVELMTLSKNRVSCWKTRRIKKANPKEWAYVMDSLKALPDANHAK